MQTKRCNICKETKPIGEFHSNGHTTAGVKKLKPGCKLCELVARKNRTWQIITKYLEPKCSICGYDKSVAALELHHLDPSQKEFGIKRVDYRNEEKIVLELKKCIMVCSNCHKEIHEKHGSIAQRREQLAHNQSVPGSSPGGPTKYRRKQNGC